IFGLFDVHGFFNVQLVALKVCEPTGELLRTLDRRGKRIIDFVDDQPTKKLSGINRASKKAIFEAVTGLGEELLLLLGSILMNIVDDGSTNYGYYPRLNFNCVNMLRFAKLESFLSVLGELGSVSFDDLHSGSARAKLLDLLESQFSFKPNTRFPSSELYVCLDRGPVLGEIAIMLRVLATPSRLMTENSIKEYFSSVKRSVLCVTQLEQPVEPRIVFNRKVFEQEFKLGWKPDQGDHSPYILKR
ncbi:unnamed protein product, partial [Ilex paraguariensis]